MALVPSAMMPLGTIAPDFNLPSSIDGRQWTLADVLGGAKDGKAKGMMVMFICNHCPFVIHIQQGLVRFANDYQKDIGIVAISANDAVKYPDDNPDNMKKVAQKLGYPFPYLFDETQEVARAYNATCTPDFFLFDADLKCVYRGQFDDSRPGNNKEVTGNDLRQAADLLLLGKPPMPEQTPSVGCSIKWK